MKKTNIFAGLTLAAVLLSACGNQSKNESENETSKTTEVVETSNKPLRVAMFTEIDSLDPFNATAGDTKTMMDQVFDGLFDVDEDGNLVPDLAESYEISEDGLTYDFKLKEGVKFHNGEDFSADDVYYTYDLLAGLTSGEPLSNSFSQIESLEKVSDSEIKIKLKEKNNSFIFLNTQPIVKKDYEDNQTHPVGTGPFEFVSYTPGEGMKLKRFNEYHNKDHVAKFEEVEILRIADRQTLVMAMNNKDIDLAMGLTADEINQVSESIDVYNSPQNLVQLLGLNNDVAPLDDPKVREAISYAVNKDEIIDTAAEGKASKLYSAFSPALKDYYNDLGELYPYNVEKAKELLKEAGYEDGFDLTITVPSDYKYHMDTAELIQAQLGEVGIRVTLDPIEFSTWLTKVYKDKDYEASVCGFIGYVDPIRVMDRYVSTNDKNFINYENADFDQAIENALTTDSDEDLAESIKDAQAIMAEDAASVFLTDPDNNRALNNELEGLKSYPVQKINLEDIEKKND